MVKTTFAEVLRSKVVLSIYKQNGQLHYRAYAPSVFVAVFLGYRSGKYFLVHPDTREGLYWTGRPEDINKSGWPWTVRRELRRKFGY